MIFKHEFNNFLLNVWFFKVQNLLDGCKSANLALVILYYPTQWIFSGHYKQKSNDFSAYPWGLWFEQTWMCTTFGWFNTSFKFSDQMVFSRLFKSILALIFLCKSWTPIVGLPTALLGHPGVKRIQCTLSFGLFNLSLQWWQKKNWIVAKLPGMLTTCTYRSICCKNRLHSYLINAPKTTWI